jgi:hypothetical protein
MRLLTEERILICGGDNLERLGGGVVREPAPATSLNSSRSGIELLLERLNRAKVTLNCVLKLAVLELAAAFLDRCEVLPKECVVDVACKR